MAGEPQWRRLHPAGLIVALARSAKALAGLIVAIGMIVMGRISSGGPNGSGMTPMLIGFALAIVVMLVLVAPIVQWLTTRYALTDRELIWESGLFFRNRRTMSYDRVHAINSVSPWYLQPFGVVGLTISAGGSSESDITLDAVNAAVQLELESLRASNMFDTQASEPSEHIKPVRDGQSEHALVFTASPRDILLYALSDIAFLASALVIWGFWNRISDVLPGWLVRRTEDTVLGVFAQGALAIAMFALFCVIVMLMVSLVSAFLRFYGFAIWRRGDDLVISRGLITKQVTTLPVSRIQSVEIRRNVLRRLLHLCTVRVGLSAVAGADDDDDDDNNGNAQSASVLLPVIGTNRVYDVMARVLPEWNLAPVRTHRTGLGLGRYYLAAPLVALLASLMALGAILLRTRTLWHPPLPLAVAAALATLAMLWWLATRALKWRTEGFALLDGSHRISATGAEQLTLVTLITRRSRVQSFARSTTAWREPHGVESVNMPLFVAVGTGAVGFHAMHRADANRLEEWMTSEAG